jgi:23S rRNA pseudouridine2605 synthase
VGEPDEALPVEGERVQKVLARAGLGSRRACDELVEDGRVTVNGEVAEPGTRVDPERDVVAVDGAPIGVRPGLVYYLLNKPAGVVTTASDPQGRPTVVEQVPSDPRVFPVGRLDAETEGLLLLTNDGDLAQRVAHPSHGVEKEYLAEIDGSPSRAELRLLREGIELDDGPTAPAKVTSVAPGALRIAIHEGRNRQIRRMCAAVGHPVVRLIRVRIGPLSDRRLRPGQWRELTQDEVRTLERAAVERPDPRPAKPGTKPGAKRAGTGAKPGAGSRSTAAKPGSSAAAARAKPGRSGAGTGARSGKLGETGARSGRPGETGARSGRPGETGARSTTKTGANAGAGSRSTAARPAVRSGRPGEPGAALSTRTGPRSEATSAVRRSAKAESSGPPGTRSKWTPGDSTRSAGRSRTRAESGGEAGAASRARSGKAGGKVSASSGDSGARSGSKSARAGKAGETGARGGAKPASRGEAGARSGGESAKTAAEGGTRASQKPGKHGKRGMAGARAAARLAAAGGAGAEPGDGSAASGSKPGQAGGRSGAEPSAKPASEAGGQAGQAGGSSGVDSGGARSGPKAGEPSDRSGEPVRGRREPRR